MKKIIALMMCLCMTFGMINAPVNAVQAAIAESGK